MGPTENEHFPEGETSWRSKKKNQKKYYSRTTDGKHVEHPKLHS